MVDKYRHKLAKEALKRHAKDVSKTLVSSDYKHKRVEDPTSISEKQEKKVKKYVKDFLDKAVTKHNEHEKRKTERVVPAQSGDNQTAGAVVVSAEPPNGAGAASADDDVNMSDVEEAPASSPAHTKRKREAEDDYDDDCNHKISHNVPTDTSLTPEDPPSSKRVKDEETTSEISPPPPPPPPPEAAPSEDDVDMTPSHIAEMARMQEEAKRFADEAEQDRVRQEQDLQRENEEAMREFEMEQKGNLTAT